jgi:hypothetical protein
MPQINWTKLVAQGRAKSVGVPLEEHEIRVSVTSEAETPASAPKQDEELDENLPTEDETELALAEAELLEAELLASQPEEPSEPEAPAAPVEGTVAPADLPPVTVTGDAPKSSEMSFKELKKALEDLKVTIPFGASKVDLEALFNAIP